MILFRIDTFTDILLHLVEIPEYGTQFPSSGKITGDVPLFHVDNPDGGYVPFRIGFLLIHGNMKTVQLVIDNGILQYIGGVLRFSSAVLVTVMLVMFIRFGFLISIGQGYGFRLLAVVI